MARKTNAELARDAENRVRDLIASCEAGGTTLPTRKGALWHAEIKRLAGLSNGQIDGNAAIRVLLLAHAGRHGIAFSRRGAVAPEEDVPPVSTRPKWSRPRGSWRCTDSWRRPNVEEASELTRPGAGR